MATTSAIGDILASPEYSQALKSFYLTEYAPGLMQSQRQVDTAKSQYEQDKLSRQQAQQEAIKRISGGYAARGMRSPSMINKDFSKIRGEYEGQNRQQQSAIDQLIADMQLQYGVQGANADTAFLTDPTLYGTIGARGRENALQSARDLIDKYNLTQPTGGYSYGQDYAAPIDMGVQTPEEVLLPEVTAPDTGASMTDAQELQKFLNRSQAFMSTPTPAPAAQTGAKTVTPKQTAAQNLATQANKTSTARRTTAATTPTVIPYKPGIVPPAPTKSITSVFKSPAATSTKKALK